MTGVVHRDHVADDEDELEAFTYYFLIICTGCSAAVFALSAL